MSINLDWNLIRLYLHIFGGFGPDLILMISSFEFGRDLDFGSINIIRISKENGI